MSFAAAALTVATCCLASAQTAMSVRSVLVSVSDASGQPIVGLLPDDFVIEAGGAAIDTLEAVPARYPLVLMVDTGAAAREFVTGFREPLLRFTARTLLSPTALVTFGDTPVVAVKFTPDARRVSRGINNLFARPDTASFLLDGLHRVAEEVKRLEVPVADAVLITAPSFDASRRDPGRVVRELVESGVRVHVVAQRARVAGTMRMPDARSRRTVSAADAMLYTSREQSAVLDDLAGATGGTFQQVDLESGLEGALQRIHERHLGEYVVSFVSPSPATSPDGLRMKVTQPGSHVTLTSMAPSASGARFD
jgi:hypothetical protein